ncbi:hypothetical protein QQY66_45695 [Streptomyces sp. DG2A-72]|nr:hypothetical protein [Streptomyces sp. DG2A-72]MDO0938663.1 hypothetical protein [Streptomyces sp. DG2A-72]
MTRKQDDAANPLRKLEIDDGQLRRIVALLRLGTRTRKKEDAQ